MKKVCKVCDITKDEVDFNLHSSGSKYRRGYCKECEKEKNRIRRMSEEYKSRVKSYTTKEEKIKMLESMSRDQYKIIKEYVLNGFFIMNFNYQTSDGIERTVKVSDFANFLRFYLGTLI